MFRGVRGQGLEEQGKQGEQGEQGKQRRKGHGEILRFTASISIYHFQLDRVLGTQRYS